MTPEARLEIEIAGQRGDWEHDFSHLPACRCGAWNVGECGCGNYVEYSEYMLQREVEYLRARAIKAAE